MTVGLSRRELEAAMEGARVAAVTEGVTEVVEMAEATATAV